MSKELKLGIVTVLAIVVALWGFQYLRGKNILGKVQSFKTVYENIEGLKMAAPVEINGYVVGSVSKIELNPESAKSMLISFDVQGEWKLPQNTVAILAADNSLVGSKKIILQFDELCKADCATNGLMLTPGYRGMLDAIVGTDDLKAKISMLKEEAGPLFDTLLYSLSNENADNAVSNSLVNLEKALENMVTMTKTMNGIMKSSYSNINSTFENMAVVSGALANTNQDLQTMITNLSDLSQQIVDADLGSTLSKTSETFDNTNKLLTNLTSTVDQANGSFDRLNSMMSKVESGEGSIGKLLNDPEIYNNLESTSKHMALLLQDLRLNPKRYVRLSVFGRKGNQYMAPEEDPAYDADLDKKE